MSPPPRWQRWLPAVFLLLAAIAAAPLFRHATQFSDRSDWRHFQTAMEVARRSVVWWHQFPLWNPYDCGGEVLLANPQAEVAAPTFLLVLIFGTALGVKLTVVVYLFCALDGMFRLARREGLEFAGALTASLLFGLGGWFALHLLVGHTNMESVGLFPYMVLCYRRALDEAEWIIPFGGLAAWVVALGGTATPAMAIVLLATLAILDAVRRRSLRPFALLAGAAIVAALVGAVRVLPALEFAIDHPRRQWETDSTAPWLLLRDGFRWMSDTPLPGKRYRFHEYGWRLPYLAAPLLVWATAIRKTRSWWIVVAVGLAISVGAFIPYGPWWLLKHLPIFRDLRVPSRYTALIAFAAPLLCGGAVDRLASVCADGRWRRPVLALLVVALAGDALGFMWARLSEITYRPGDLATRDVTFYQVIGDWRTTMLYVLQNHGALACDEEAPLQRAAELDEGAVPQVRLLEPTAGEIGATAWTQNELTVVVDLVRPTTVMFNQNWNEHWRTPLGVVVKVGEKNTADSDGGRLGLSLPTGRHMARLTYRPMMFVIGGVITVVTAPLLVIAFLVKRRRRSRSLS